MTDIALKTGFYANNVETLYVSETGRAWIVASQDNDKVEEIAVFDFPSDATEADDLVDNDFADELKEIAEIEAATADVRERVVAKAKEYAAAFVAEFNEAIDPATTDWDSTAWDAAEPELRLDKGEEYRLWPVFQAALVAETERLCGD